MNEMAKKKMTKEELIQRLREIKNNSDKEMGHMEADSLLLDYIGDDEIAAAYESISKWYA